MNGKRTAELWKMYNDMIVLSEEELIELYEGFKQISDFFHYSGDSRPSSVYYAHYLETFARAIETREQRKST